MTSTLPEEPEGTQVARWDGLTLPQALEREAVLKVLLAEVKAATEEARGQAFQLMTALEAETGSKSFNVKVRQEGQDYGMADIVGRATLTQPSESRYIASPELFLAWMEAHQPTSVFTFKERRVYTAAANLLLEDATPTEDGRLVDPNGEVILGAAYKPAGAPTTHSMAFDKKTDGKGKVIQAIKSGLAEGMVPALTDGSENA